MLKDVVVVVAKLYDFVSSVVKLGVVENMENKKIGKHGYCMFYQMLLFAFE